MLTKHWNAIAARRNADAPHRPHIECFADQALGQGWAQGFVAGMNLSAAAWDPVMENEEEGDIALPILALAVHDSMLLPDE
jgi:yecA family protein